MKMPVSALQLGWEESPITAKGWTACWNPECEWNGPESETVIFKHDRDRADHPLFCPECHEICEPL